MTWKLPVFDMLNVISAIFEDIDLKILCILINHCPQTYSRVFLEKKNYFEGENLKKMLKILEILGNFQHFQNPK